MRRSALAENHVIPESPDSIGNQLKAKGYDRRIEGARYIGNRIVFSIADGTEFGEFSACDAAQVFLKGNEDGK